MSKWTKQKLGTVGRVITGKTPPTSRQELYGAKYPFITPTDISDGSIYVNQPERFLSEEGATYLKSSRLPKNAICYTCIASIGKIAITTRDSFTNQQINSVVVDNTRYNHWFLFYLLKHKTPQIKLMAGGVASPILNKTAFENLELEIPDLLTQTYIAYILSAYDDLIEINEKRIKILEEMAQRLYTEWFVKYKFPGYERVKMVDSGTEYGMVPEGWEVYPLRELITPQYGYTASANNDNNFPKYLRGTDINKNSFIDWSRVPNCIIDETDFLKYQIHKGDVFIIRMADPGKIGICEVDISAVFASYLIRLKIKSKLLPYYLYYFVTSDKYQNFITGASSGTTRKSVNSQQVGSINVLIPDEAILTLFEGKVSLLRSDLTNLVALNDNLTKIRDLLIPQLVTGRRELKGIKYE